MHGMTATLCMATAAARPLSPLNDDGTVALVLAVILAVLLTCSTGRRYVADMFHRMFSVRRRENLFEDHTFRETQTLTALIANTCLWEGILLYEAFTGLYAAGSSAMPVFPVVASLAVGGGLFYIVQLAAYYLLGYVFASGVETRLWVDGFKATQAILGIILAPVGFVALVSPAATQNMLFLSAVLYFIARLVFICKGFRIFFNNLSSLLYFILYLCGVEIVPVILSFAGAMKLCVIFQQAV